LVWHPMPRTSHTGLVAMVKFRTDAASGPANTFLITHLPQPIPLWYDP